MRWKSYRSMGIENRVAMAAVAFCLFVGEHRAMEAHAGQTYAGDQRRQANPAAVAEVQAGKRTEANAAWWGFDPKDSTRFLQAAINSGAKTVIVSNMGADWIITPITLAGDQEIIFEPGVVVTAKPGEFHGTHDSLFRADSKTGITLIGYGATLRMQKADYQSDKYQK